MPANSKFAKLIKACFEPIPGWLFVGSDFDSLESKINALLTRDENQMSVYTDGFDGHSLRAFYYFRDQMPDIQKAEEGDKCFKIEINKQVLYCKSGDFVIDSNNTKIPVEEYYEKITGNRL